MPVLFSRAVDSQSQANALWIDDYIKKLDQGLLTPTLVALGFKTSVQALDLTALAFINEVDYIDIFRKHGQHLLSDSTPAPQGADLENLVLAGDRSLSTISESEEEDTRATVIESSRRTMSRRPSLMVNGLPSVQEDHSASTAPNASSIISPQRSAARLNMLRQMRPPPFQYAWTFYHEKDVQKHFANNTPIAYEDRLTVLLDNIITLKQFWEAYNGFPLEKLKLKDSVHFFKRGVKPIWEDPRNLNGGAWCFRVPKEKSEQTWKEILLLAVGEQFADVIQPSTFSVEHMIIIRYTSSSSHIVTILLFVTCSQVPSLANKSASPLPTLLTPLSQKTTSVAYRFLSASTRISLPSGTGTAATKLRPSAFSRSSSINSPPSSNQRSHRTITRSTANIRSMKPSSRKRKTSEL